MTIELNITDEALEALARRIAELVRVESPRQDEAGFVDVNGAAALLATSPAGIRAHVKRRTIPFHKLGGRLLFDPRELRKWVESGD